jgi:hypothetical protein
VFVSGSACANFAVGLDAASGLISLGEADSVLLVIADPDPVRHPLPVSQHHRLQRRHGVLPRGPGRRAGSRIPAPSRHQGHRVGTRSATGRAAGGAAGSFEHLVTPDFGSATRRVDMRDPADGDRLLAVMSSGYTLAALAFEYCDPERSAAG